MKAAAILTGLAVALTLGLAASSAAESPGAQADEFFEKHVRPVLAEHCFTCHGPRKQSAGLRLDSRPAALAGSKSGPVLVPGHPEQSRLIHAIRYQGDRKMPPRGKLPDDAVAALTTWVKLGAPWPGSLAGAGPAPSPAVAAWKTHWSFQPVHKPAVPTVKASAGVRTPIDAFILARLEEKGLSPSPPADRRTLIRRATFDLTGLPPTPAEVAAFEADSSPDAFEKVVDRLLASPAYGERWGRYWLDVARYADTRGYVFDQERKFPCSWTYRDYVIRAFNEDLPYDRFILQQLAADRLPLGNDKRPLAALGFLTLGSAFMNNPHDVIDDRIDVVCRGLLGLTVTCARCHDHKFDPIPQKDYYSLYGVFASSEEPRALPVIVSPGERASSAGFERELHAREEKLDRLLQAKHDELTAGFRARAGEYLLAAQTARRQPRTDEFMFVTEARDLNPREVQHWQRFLEVNRQASHPVLSAWYAFADLPEKEFAARAPALAAQFAANADPKHHINPLVARAFAGKPPANLQEVARRYGDLFAEVDREWQKALEAAKGKPGTPVTKLDDPDREQVRGLLYGPSAPADVPMGEVVRFLLDRATRKQIQDLRNDLEHFKGASPDAPPRAMVLVDSPNPVEPHVFVRGNPNQQGEAVPRRFLQVLAGEHREPFHQGSGRLDLAQAIVRPDNPLTARVMVNRIWLHHFGAGLVRTPSDLGLRGEPPTHPELLDWLASKFIEDGWSVKKLHRLIMLSAVYQQASEDDPHSRALDPEDRLLWKMSRRRLDFEALRDSLLAVSGKLDRTLGGRQVDLTSQPFTGRRTVYGFIDRQNLPAMFRTFDFPNPDATNPQRYQTTVPLQALFLMNSPFVAEQARALVSRPEVAARTHPAERIQELYRLAYGRAAEPDEVELGLRFVQGREDRPAPKEGPRPLNAWEEYAQALLLANEFVFID